MHSFETPGYGSFGLAGFGQTTFALAETLIHEIIDIVNGAVFQPNDVTLLMHYQRQQINSLGTREQGGEFLVLARSGIDEPSRSGAIIIDYDGTALGPLQEYSIPGHGFLRWLNGAPKAVPH